MDLPLQLWQRERGLWIFATGREYKIMRLPGSGSGFRLRLLPGARPMNKTESSDRDERNMSQLKIFRGPQADRSDSPRA